MKVISLISQKGGSGKSTLLCNLAVAAKAISGKRVLIADADPQETLFGWWEEREDKNIECIQVDASDIERTPDVASEHDFDYLFIDTAGRAAEINAAVIRMSDLCIVPCRPTVPDLKAQQITAEMVKSVDKSGVFVMTQTSTRGTRAIESRQALEALDFPVCDKSIGYLMAYQDSFAEGLGVLEFEPNGLAALEIRGVWKWLQPYLEVK